MFSCSPKRWRTPAPRPACRAPSRPSLPAKPSPARANCCTDSALDAAALREDVTSPGGTTAAALDVLMGADGLAQLMKKAVAAATAALPEAGGVNRAGRLRGRASGLHLHFSKRL